jgi:phage-related protein
MTTLPFNGKAYKRNRLDQGGKEGVRGFSRRCTDRALTIIAEGGMPEIAKPLTGLGAGILELALRHRGDAFRVVYALQIGADIWVVHAFQKKSKSGIKTPKAEIDLIRQRLKRLKEML